MESGLLKHRKNSTSSSFTDSVFPSGPSNSNFNELNKQHHIPTTPFRKALIAIGSSLHALSNPERGDMVASVGETTGAQALERIYQSMKSDPVGRQILEEKPLINSKTVDMNKLRLIRYVHTLLKFY